MRFWLRAAIGWTVMILALCWMPRSVVATAGEETRLFKIPNFDKLVHLSLFVGFAFLWLKASIGPRRYLYVFLGGLALAVGSELGQLSGFVNRDARLDDGVFDMLGVLLGFAAYRLVDRREAIADAPLTQTEAS